MEAADFLPTHREAINEATQHVPPRSQQLIFFYLSGGRPDVLSDGSFAKCHFIKRLKRSFFISN
jgi:hypothetical protein